MATMDKAVNDVVAYTDESGVSPFWKWVSGLRDKTAKAKIITQVKRMRKGPPSKKNTRSVGGGVSELKIPYGPGYRLYYGQRGERIYILLCGGDKSSQQQDIKQAKAYWKEHKRSKQT